MPDDPPPRSDSAIPLMLTRPRVVQNFGPFVAKYTAFMEQMSVLYQNAKNKHALGLEMLMKHFDYHPELKRWSDTFSAVPFRPM